MDEKQASYYLHRVYRLLKSDKATIVFKKMRTKRGETDQKTIWLNPRESILPTFIHECLHVLYWHWSETKVEKCAMQIFNRLTPRQTKNLLLRLALIINKINIE